MCTTRHILIDVFLRLTFRHRPSISYVLHWTHCLKQNIPMSHEARRACMLLQAYTLNLDSSSQEQKYFCFLTFSCARGNIKPAACIWIRIETNRHPSKHIDKHTNRHNNTSKPTQKDLCEEANSERRCAGSTGVG